jgi:hypothetical protein
VARRSRDPGKFDICANPVFIIGSPRSGTTALAAALGKHSQLWSSRESDFLYYLFEAHHAEHAFERTEARPDMGWIHAEGVDRAEFLEYVGLGLNALFTSRSGGTRWVDQTPLYTMIVESLAELFPGSSFVHMLRDGRRVVHSMLHFLRAPGLTSPLSKDFVGSWTSDFRIACRTWRDYVERAEQFRASNGTRCVTVVNEDLLRDPSKGFRRIFELIGVPYEDAPGEFLTTHRINSSFVDDYSGRLRGPEVESPWDQWTLEQRLIFLEEAGQTFAKMPFAPEGDFTLAGGNNNPEIVLAGMRQAVDAVVPRDAELLVVSKGDDDLIHLDGRRTSHFPRTAEGYYAGQDPADSADAITQLDAARKQGATFFLIPAHAYWWLDYYTELRAHLASRYARIWCDAACILYDLRLEEPR